MSFTDNGYMTRGYSEEIPLVSQLALAMALKKRVDTHKQIDYLQVFKLSRCTDSNGATYQKIVHEQEQPPLKDTYLLLTDEAVEETVFCIDDGDHYTFLLAREY